MIFKKGHLLLSRAVRAANFISEWSGRLTAWLIMAMVLLISYDVFMRYAFSFGSVALQELEWHLFALTFLLGAAYTLRHNGHVRVDILYRSKWMNARRRDWVNLLGGLLFLAPFCLLIIVSSWPFVHNAFVQMESSPDPGGLPYRWLLKAAIPVSFSLLLLEGLADALRHFLRLSGQEEEPK
ncbi:MAG: TRAP transporter small permease subunit [Gammaproteobacteria bacterium]|nr:TRAP transporter small permease subunit [Gammaproteobacteria bacterium]